MEAAPQSQTDGQAPAGQKLQIDKFADGSISCLKFAGAIDEDFDGKKLATTVKAKTLVLDLADIKKISSFGIREWVDFINAVVKVTDEIILLECAPKVVDQLNMVANFAGSGKVFSFYAPYRCDYCDSDSSVLMQVDRDWDIIKSMKPEERPCSSCGEPEYFDEDPTSYFSYIAGQDKFEIDAEVAAFLSAKLNYVVSEAARRLKVDKVIGERSTYLKLSGDLDGSFPRDKLAEGMEGIIVLDVSGVGKIEPAGAAEWRTFIQMIGPPSEAVYLLGCPPGFLEKLTKSEDLGPKTQVVTFAMPYSCEKCATTSTQQVDVAEHFDVLKFATPPEMKCSDCKSPTVCAATEGLLSHLPTLPKPTITAPTRKFIKEVKDRKPEKKATTLAEAAAAGKGAGTGTVLAAAAVAAVLAVGGVLGFNYYKEQQAQNAAKARDSVGKLVESSAAERPAWLTSETRFSNYCVIDASGLMCVGVSSYADNVEDARTEAQEAALEGVAQEIGMKIDNPDWQSNVRKLYGESRQAKLTAFEKARAETSASEYASAKKEVHDARRAVAESLRKTSGGAVPPQPAGEYWEQYETATGDAGTRFLMFVQYRLSPDTVARLVDLYGEPQEVQGAQVVTAFPGIAWRYPKVISGAVIVNSSDSKLVGIGLVDQYIVLSVQDRLITDAAAFVKIMNDEFEQAKEEGGNLKLEVKTGDQPPVIFNRPIQGEIRKEPPRNGGNRGGGNRGGGNRGGGNINTWDKAGGGAGSRDNPYD